jgi:hypothetical protein
MPGDLMWFQFYENGPAGMWSPIRHATTLAFPAVISSVSIGPGWNQ